MSASERARPEPRGAGTLPPFLRTLAPIVGLALTAASVFAIGFAPLFDGPGYEIALAAGVIVPSIVAITTALELASALSAARSSAESGARDASSSSPTFARDLGSSLLPQPLDLLFRGLANGATFGLAAYVTTLIHGARTGFCDAWTGTWTFALGPFAGALLAGAWGALAGEIASRRKRPRARRALAVALAFAGPLTGVIVSLARFFGSPMVFAFDPFAGYFSGTLYDTVIDASGLVTYRAGTLATLAAALALALHLRRTETGGLRLAWLRAGSPSPTDVSRPRYGVALAGVLCAIASLAHMAAGTTLGHYQTPSSIALALGARADGDRCTVLYPRGTRPDEIDRFVRDCDANVRQVEAWFEAKGPERITVYLFADVRQKAQLMGAADTQIAKPWRREVYVQSTAYPHPVLGHELAHVIAGTFARGPFLTGGDLLGLLPNPGLIEGVAVAASPREGDMSPAEWARAMKEIGILPRLDRLFALGFLGANSGVAYTVSGAFVAFVKDTFGIAAVRDWYGGKSLPSVTGTSWPDLEAKFLASLDALPLSDAARAQAKARFDRPGIFGRRCPHVVDACHRKAGALRDAGDDDGVIEQLTTVRALDPGDAGVLVSLARARIRKGELEGGTADLRALAANTSIPRHIRDRALEDLADLALAPGGDGAFAAATYRDLMTRIVDEDTLRTLEVKAMAAETPRARTAIYEYLVGAPGRGPDRVRAAELFALWSKEAPTDGMPDYLMGRYFHGNGLYAEAAVRLDQALARKLPTPRVEVEAIRLRLVGACALHDPIAARKAYDAYRGRAEVPRARRDAMAALVERCTKEAGPSPTVP